MGSTLQVEAVVPLTGRTAAHSMYRGRSVKKHQHPHPHLDHVRTRSAFAPMLLADPDIFDAVGRLVSIPLPSRVGWQWFQLSRQLPQRNKTLAMELLATTLMQIHSTSCDTGHKHV